VVSTTLRRVGTSDTINLAMAACARVARRVSDRPAGSHRPWRPVPLFTAFSEKRLTGTTNGSIRPHVESRRARSLHPRLPLDALITRAYALTTSDPRWHVGRLPPRRRLF